MLKRPPAKVVISLVAQTKAPSRVASSGAEADSPAYYPFGWANTFVGLVVLDPAEDWQKTTLDIRCEGLRCLEGDARAKEAVFIVSDVGDLDGDGEEEIVAGISLLSGESYLLSYKRRDGQWVPSVIAEPEASGFIRSIATGDIDGDSEAEIVIGTRADGLVALFDRVDGRYVYSVVDVDKSGSDSNVREVIIGDINNDGKPEIIATVATANTAYKWSRVPGTIFMYSCAPGQDRWQRSVMEDFGGATHSRMAAIGLLSGDSHNSLVANSVGVHDEKTNIIDPESAMWTYKVSSGGDVTKSHVATLPNAVKSRGFAIGDVDGDGENEIVLGTRGLNIDGCRDTYLLVFKYDAGSGKWVKEQIDECDDPLGFHCVGVMDVDGDGQDEIVASIDGKGLVKSYKKTANGWESRVVLEYPYRLFVVAITALHQHEASSKAAI